MTRGDFTVTYLRKAKTSLQLYVMVANVSAVDLLFFSVLFFESSSDYSSSLLLSSSLFPLSFSSSSNLSVMERVKILKNSSTEVFTSRIFASVKNGRRRTALRGVQYRCFLDLARSPAEARRSISAIRRRILLLSTEKAIMTSIETAEGESSDPVRGNDATDSPRDLFPTDAFENVSCTSHDMALLVSKVILGKLSHTF